MKPGLAYTVFESGRGWIGLLRSGRGLRRATLPQDSARGAEALLGAEVSRAELSPHHFTGIASRLVAYLSGHRVAFADELDLSAATAFRRRVWLAVRDIPYGETRSYSWVAAQLGDGEARRAVGQALAANPLPLIIPCHRVVARHGPGGYSGGVEMKRYLLRLEAAG